MEEEEQCCTYGHCDNNALQQCLEAFIQDSLVTSEGIGRLCKCDVLHMMLYRKKNVNTNSIQNFVIQFKQILVKV